jgi:F-type H+/Na+-transporting ATPase subunit alpha
VRPAADVGLSVSRVGGKAQPEVLRQLASDLRLLCAQLHELESFARFGAEPQTKTRHRLTRGRCLRKTLEQLCLDPLRVRHKVALLCAIRESYLDQVAVDQVVDFLDKL